MNKKIILFLNFIGLIFLLSSCEKDQDKVYLSDNPVAPSIESLPDLTLQRDNASDIVIFRGTPLDPGFTASVTYFLEACEAGSKFEDVLQLYSGITIDTIQFSVGELNTILLRKFTEDKTTSVDFRIRAVLTVDAGTGALGSGSNPLQYMSEVSNAAVTIYGNPRLDLLNSGVEQKIESPAGNGVYSGYVQLDPNQPFTLENPDAGTIYGDSDGALAVDGDAITPKAEGWHSLTVDINEGTYTLEAYSVGVVGEFTGWGESPDYPMDYNSKGAYWYVTIDLPVGPMKFRLNSNWDSGNWGPGSDKDLPSGGGTMALPGSNGNINITAAGNYTIQLSLSGSSGSVTFIKNN